MKFNKEIIGSIDHVDAMKACQISEEVFQAFMPFWFSILHGVCNENGENLEMDIENLRKYNIDIVISRRV